MADNQEVNELSDNQEVSTSTSSLNIDMCIEILKRVKDVKALGRCLVASKELYGLIKSRSFIKEQVNVSSNHPQNTLLFSEIMKEYPFFQIHRLFDDQHSLVNKFHCPFRTSSHVFYRFVGSTNGIILLFSEEFSEGENYILWNPLIKRYLKLPDRPWAHFNCNVVSALGFAYDSVKDDYKVVRVLYVQGKYELDVVPPRVEIYSLIEGIWRFFEADEDVNYCIAEECRWPGCFLNGCLHWVAFERREDDGGPKALGFKRNGMLLFDVVKEKFKKVGVPTEVAEVCPHSLRLFDNRGLLGLVHTSKRVSGDPCFDIWVMKEYNVGTSWSKLVGGLFMPLCTLRNGNVILPTFRLGEEECYEGELVSLMSYDYETGMSQSICAIDFLKNCHATSPFIQSLVLLDKERVSVQNNRLREGSSYAMVDDDSGSESFIEYPEYNQDAINQKGRKRCKRILRRRQMTKFRHNFEV